MIAPSEDLRKELVKWVRTEIGPIASPDLILWAPGLPKTRSGKIMRRILRKIAENDYGALGDISTLADPGVTRKRGAPPPLACGKSPPRIFAEAEMPPFHLGANIPRGCGGVKPPPRRPDQGRRPGKHGD